MQVFQQREVAAVQRYEVMCGQDVKCRQTGFLRCLAVGTLFFMIVRSIEKRHSYGRALQRLHSERGGDKRTDRLISVKRVVVEVGAALNLLHHIPSGSDVGGSNGQRSLNRTEYSIRPVGDLIIQCVLSRLQIYRNIQLALLRQRVPPYIIRTARQRVPQIGESVALATFHLRHYVKHLIGTHSCPLQSSQHYASGIVFGYIVIVALVVIAAGKQPQRHGQTQQALSHYIVRHNILHF